VSQSGFVRCEAAAGGVSPLPPRAFVSGSPGFLVRADDGATEEPAEGGFVSGSPGFVLREVDGATEER